MLKKLVLFLLFLGVGLIFYYSWLPDHNMTSETYLPKWLLDWSNKHYNLRTAIPFVFFGFLLEEYSHSKTVSKMEINKNLIFIQNIAVAALVVSIAECGQFLIINRSPDLMDIYFGIIGSLIGGLVHILFEKVIKLRNAK